MNERDRINRSGYDEVRTTAKWLIERKEPCIHYRERRKELMMSKGRHSVPAMFSLLFMNNSAISLHRNLSWSASASRAAKMTFLHICSSRFVFIYYIFWLVSHLGYLNACHQLESRSQIALPSVMRA